MSEEELENKLKSYETSFNQREFNLRTLMEKCVNLGVKYQIDVSKTK